MRFLFVLVTTFFLSGCKQHQYPEIIIEFELEELYDKAKWEVYKLNSVGTDSRSVEFIVNHNFTSDSIRHVFYSIIGSRSKSTDKRKEIEKLLGPKNVRNYIDAKLELFGQDSTDIFKNDEIRLTFFPKSEKGQYFRKTGGGHCYTIIFKEEKIVEIGCDDYVEFGYNSENQDRLELEFEKFLKTKKTCHPWLTLYQKKRKAQSK